MAQMFKKRHLSDNLFKIFNLVFGLFIAIMYVHALVYPNLGVDASYYLRVTECIADGAIPEYDLRILYPPLVFYMLLPIKLIVGNAIAYEVFLGYMFLIQLFNAFFIYKISGKYSSNSFIRIFAGLCYLFLSIKLQGDYLFLEPFINFWGLLAILAYLYKSKGSNSFLLLSGALAFLAFLTKQYGLAFAGVVYVMILIDERSSFKDIVRKGIVFSAGIAGGLLLFIVLFRIGYGVYYDFFAGGRLTLYGEKNASVMIAGLIKYIKLAPYLLFLLVPHVFRKLLKTKTHFLAFLVLVLLFSVQLYFQQYDHYYILMLPGLILTGVMLFDLYFTGSRFLVISVLLISLLSSELFIGPRTRGLIFDTNSTLAKEIALANEINQVLPEGTHAYLFGEVKFYYLCHINSAVPEKYGYAYNNALYYGDFVEIIDRADYLMIRADHLEMKYPLIDKAINIREEPDFKKYEKIQQVGEYLIFKKNALND